MTMPTAAVTTTNLDGSTDSPASARADLLDAVQKLNQLITHISTFAGTLLDDTSAAAARSTLGAQASLGYTAADDSAVVHKTGTETVAGVKTFSSQPVLADGALFGDAPMDIPSGDAPVFGCRAWCKFNGTLTGTNAPIAGGNVASVTRNSVGNYTINFTTAMPDGNYAIVVTPQSNTSAPYVSAGNQSTPNAAGSCRVTVTFGNLGADSSASYADVPSIHVVVFR